jgi:hypothetical protein
MSDRPRSMLSPSSYVSGGRNMAPGGKISKLAGDRQVIGTLTKQSQVSIAECDSSNK